MTPQVLGDLPAAGSTVSAGWHTGLSHSRPLTVPLSEAPARGSEASQRVQRARVFIALASLADEHGVGKVTATQVIERARISRKSFYQLFVDFDDCLQAALKDGCARMVLAVRPAYQRPASWRGRVRTALWALLCFLDAEPATGRLCMVGALGAGPEVLRWRASMLRAVVVAVDEGRSDPEAVGEPARLAAEGVVGAVLSVLHSRMVAREPASGLLNELMALVVLPYLGPDAAQRELRREEPPHMPVRAAPHEHISGTDLRLTYRTLRVLQAVARAPGGSNRQVADGADIVDGAQISRLLARLNGLELVENASAGNPSANAWRLTPQGEALAALSRCWLDA